MFSPNALGSQRGLMIRIRLSDRDNEVYVTHRPHKHTLSVLAGIHCMCSHNTEAGVGSGETILMNIRTHIRGYAHACARFGFLCSDWC